MAEHMTFNHGVRSSTLRWVTKTEGIRTCSDAFCFGDPSYQSRTLPIASQTKDFCYLNAIGERACAFFDISDGGNKIISELVRIPLFLLTYFTSRALQIRKDLEERAGREMRGYSCIKPRVWVLTLRWLWAELIQSPTKRRYFCNRNAIGERACAFFDVSDGEMSVQIRLNCQKQSYECPQLSNIIP